MKTRISFGILAVMLAAVGARGSFIQTYTETFNGVNTYIPDGNPVGITSQETFSGTPSLATINSVTVSLDISGGYNGNLVAYLVAPNGTSVYLLNHPGGAPFGAAGSGFGSAPGTYDFTLSDLGLTSIQTASETAGAAVTGTYSAAGALSGFSGTADGTWDLFIADMVSGGGTSELTGWQLNVSEVVPEPVNGALMVFAVLGGLLWLGRRVKARMATPAEPKM
jgi:subtilisin-like proprotein convertase family protein